MMLPAGWVEQQRQGQFIFAKRALESAMFHVHDAPIHGTRSAPPTAHYCTWYGNEVQCCACGSETRYAVNGRASND